MRTVKLENGTELKFSLKVIRGQEFEILDHPGVWPGTLEEMAKYCQLGVYYLDEVTGDRVRSDIYYKRQEFYNRILKEGIKNANNDDLLKTLCLNFEEPQETGGGVVGTVEESLWHIESVLDECYKFLDNKKIQVSLDRLMYLIDITLKTRIPLLYKELNIKQR